MDGRCRLFFILVQFYQRGCCYLTYDPRETPAYSFEYAKEFRYDGARQRYLVRELNANMALISEKWSDYDGSSIYGSYSVTSGTANELMSYQPGIGQVDTSLATPVSKYYHTDMIGTTKLLTDGVSAATSGGSVLTAFGEHVAGSTHRYGYAGTHGYQTDDGSSDVFPFMHVGHRYYDPSTGRFLQRDPIGINGGLNVYEYVGSRPVLGCDPNGLAWEMFSWFDAKVAAAKAFIWLTGGEDSWLDDPKDVETAQKIAGFTAGLCLAFTPFGPALGYGSSFYGGWRFAGGAGNATLDGFSVGSGVGGGFRALGPKMMPGPGQWGPATKAF